MHKLNWLFWGLVYKKIKKLENNKCQIIIASFFSQLDLAGNDKVDQALKNRVKRKGQ